jgi:hypothetical protein
MLLKSPKLNRNKVWYSVPSITLMLLTMCFGVSLSLTHEVCPEAESKLENCPTCAVLVDSEFATVAYFDTSIVLQTASSIISTRSVAIPIPLEKRSHLSRGPPLLISTFFSA